MTYRTAKPPHSPASKAAARSTGTGARGRTIVDAAHPFKTLPSTLRGTFRTRPPGARESEAAAFGRVRFFTIAEVAESLHVATRTVRRWIKAGDLVAHRAGAVVRIAEADLRAFLALHREG
jgi:excisionase family DNA binding protein